MRQDHALSSRAADATDVLLVTDSLDPSGVGHHMIALAAHLGPEWAPRLAFAAGPLARGFMAKARGLGLPAQVVTADGWDALLLQGPGLCHVHAGIGWEGQALVARARRAGWCVVRTEHLPYLLSDPLQRLDHAAMVASLDGFIAVSRSAGASWTAALAHSGAAIGATVIRNGIAPGKPRKQPRAVRAALGVPLDSPLFLHIGRFTAQKGHETLIAAFTTVAATHPTARLLLIGQGERRAAVQAASARAGLTGVIFCDARDDVPDLMAAANVLVLPSLFEGLPLVLLEAMAAGLPIVATRIGGVTDALGLDHPYLVPPNDPGALPSTMLAQITDPAGARAVAAHQRTRFLTGFTAQRMAADTGTVYRRALGRRNSLNRKNTMATGADVGLVNVGFVGAGGIAARHIDVLRQFADVHVAAVCDADLARATQTAGPLGAQAFGDVATMLAGVALDALFICVPPFAHGPAERAAIAAGIPFFVEKPITQDLALAEAISQEVTAAGLITAVGYHWRYLDTVDRARRALVDKPAQLIVGHWHDSTPPPEWWGRQAQSGGQMVEQVTHLIDTARFLAGGITSVHAAGNHLPRERFPGLDVPTASVATVTFEGGAVASFSATCVLNWNHRQGLHVFADGLAIEVSDREVMIDTGHGRHPVGAQGDPVWREDRDFIDAVRGGANNIRTSYADALETHRAALAVAQSMRSGQPVQLVPVAAAPLPFGGQLRRPYAARDAHRQIRSLGVDAPGRAAFFDYDEGPAGQGQVRLDTCFTGLSAGTELTFLKNTNPYLFSSWDAEAGVFRDGAPALRYPVPFLGYMEVGQVIDAPDGGFAVGQMVAGTWGHKTGHTAAAVDGGLVVMPDALDPVLGVFVAQMGPIAANAILYADALAHGRTPVAFGAGVAGRRVLVWGGGTVGLMTALFARAAGAAEVIVAEPSVFRRHVAGKLGFDACAEDDAWQRAKGWGQAGDRGADLVFQTRAHGHSLHLALRALRPQGTVIDLAFYQGGTPELRLGEEFHHNGLSLIAAQIGRVPAGLSDTWTRKRLCDETLALLLAQGIAIRAALITHVVPFDEAPRFLEHLLADRPEFLQIVFATGA